MITNVGDLNDIARRMLWHYGEHAAALMETRARNHRRRGDDEGATLWQQVGNAVRKIAEAESLPVAGSASRI
jgi:hypothetical protein